MMLRRLIIFCVLFSALGRSYAEESAADESPPAPRPIVIDPTDPTRKLQFLIFYPHRGEYSVSPSYQSSINVNTVVKDTNGVETRTTTTSFSQVALNVVQALDDRYRLGVSATELISSVTNTENKLLGTTSELKSAGLSSPTFSFNYRAVNNREKNFYSDISFSFTPQLALHKTPTPTQTGDNWPTSWSATLTAPFYWLRKRHEFEVAIQASYHFSGESQGAALVANNEYNDYWTGLIQFADRYHLNRYWFVEPLATLNFPQRYTSTDESTNVVTTTNYNFYLGSQFELGYLTNPNCLVYLTINYGFDTHSVTPSNTNGTEVSTSSLGGTIGSRFKF